MKKSFAFSFLLTSFITLFSQTHFITAGQTQGMIYTDCVPDIFVPGNFNIDVNRDGVDDFRIAYSYSSFNSGFSGYISYEIFTFNQNSVGIKIDTCKGYSDGHNVITNTYSNVTKKFLASDTMIESSSFQWLSTNVGYANIYNHSWNSSPSHGSSVTCTDFEYAPSDSFYYYFLRVVTNTDTLFGYLHFTTGGSEIMDYACEGPTSSYIISSINDLAPSNISISPNPFTNQINITTEKPFQFTICDYMGRVVMQGESDKTIATEVLASGGYILTIKNEEILSVKKMVKY